MFTEKLYGELDIEKNAIWSLMLGNGYLKVSDSRTVETSDGWDHVYGVSVTNLEVLIMLKKMVRSWFTSSSSKILTRGKSLLRLQSRNGFTMDSY